MNSDEEKVDMGWGLLATSPQNKEASFVIKMLERNSRRNPAEGESREIQSMTSSPGKKGSCRSWSAVACGS